MPKPTFLMFILSIAGLLLFAYYRTIGRNSLRNRSPINTYMLYVVLVVSCIVFIWGVAAMIFPNP